VPRGFVGALGTELFVGRTVSSALCRELPLGRACAESILHSAKAANPVVIVYVYMHIKNYVYIKKETSI
jgi:hypothetical protein